MEIVSLFSFAVVLVAEISLSLPVYLSQSVQFFSPCRAFMDLRIFVPRSLL